MFRSLFFVCLCVVGSTAAGGKKWDYSSKQYGVSAWPDNFEACNGSSQSPIDIKDTTYSNLGNISFANYDAQNVRVDAKNNGHTYVATFPGFTDTTTPKISGGGLPGEFNLAQFHFHWGNHTSLGSEHHVNGTDFPAELHFVHLNRKYNDVSEGLKYPDGLAVLGVLYLEGEHNDNYNFLNLAVNNVAYEGMNASFNLSTTLMGLLPTDKSFYRYNGSLTTPGCQEVVTWTVFSHYVYVSAAQLNALRGMFYTNFMNNTKPLVNNHRTIQPTNGRRVLLFGSAETVPPSIMATSTRQTVPSTTMATSTRQTVPSTTIATSTIVGPSTTASAYTVSENGFMLLASLCLVLLSFLEI